MRRLLVLLLVPLFFLAAACSGDSDDSDGDSGGGSLDDVAVSGKVGESPTIEGAEGVAVDEVTTRVVTEGDGAEVKDGDIIDLRYVLVQATDGAEMSNTFDQEQITTINAEQDPVLSANLVGQSIGSRVLIGMNVSDIAGESAGDAGDDTLVVVADLVSEWDPPKPNGTIDDVAVSDAPFNKEPKVTLDTKPLYVAETESKDVIKGKGAKVADGDSITVRYVGINGRDGKEFDSSWGPPDGDTTDFTIAQGQMITGFVNGLVGHRIGSRVLVAFPYDQGYELGTIPPDSGIKAGDTYIFVVDLVKKAAPPAQQ